MKRILVVDDEPDMTFMVKVALEQTGDFEVFEVNNSSHTLTAAREFRPDLILLDVMMPDMDGGDVAAWLKTDDSLKDVPIIFLTAMVLEDEVQAKRGHIAGHPFLPKPVTVEKLVESIHEHMRPG